MSLAEFCRANLDFDKIELGSEYGYDNVPLCIIDAVFSIGVHYSSVQNTVNRFCDFLGLIKSNGEQITDSSNQLSVSAFLKMYAELGINGMAKQVYQNRQRTSTRNGILKAEAVLRFAQITHKYGVEYLQDVDKILGNPEFEAEITQIPGHRSGISLRYFYMLAGSEDFIKPDRMINRFVYEATGKHFGIYVNWCILRKLFSNRFRECLQAGSAFKRYN